MSSTPQNGYLERVRQIIREKYQRRPLAFVHTYGCQQNVSDSERLMGLIELMGFDFTDGPDNADLVLYNTCAVREHAEDRVFGNIGALKSAKRRRPDMIICVCGCMAQQASAADKIRRSYPYVDILFGTHVRHRLPEFVYRRLTTGERIFENPETDEGFIEDVLSRHDRAVKAWLPVMQGCDNFCSYCIVPYVRGREHSREPSAIIAEAERLIASGAKEITLLGQNVNSYGRGNRSDLNFAGLLRKLNALDGEFRIRFMTSHPKDCSEELLEAVAECDKVEKHLHLPVQCGSDGILKRMNRRYTVGEYLKLVGRARELMPDVQFTSDIIVGFPGETYEDFKGTLRLVEEVGYYSLFTFIFSPRPGTPAAGLPDPVTRKEKSEWFSELLETQERISRSINASLIGKRVRLLFEDNDGDSAVGRSNENLVVRVSCGRDMTGKFADARITSFDGVLHGEII